MPSLLVVEDDANIRQSLLERFRGRGLSVSTAASGREAFARIVRERPDAVILDLQLPEGDGLWVLQRLREEEIEATVVVVTAFGTIERAVQAMKQGAYDFLTKPFEPAVVEESVRRALERTTLRRASRARGEPVLVGLA
ncbi:MAG TPA: response regulator, partial [Planctomycetota bacterium]|nr:response regulator [Planctomycetota bacterium]